MSAEVQHLLDRLADDIGRSVVINDPAVVMLYSSRHFGDEDPVRVEAMLNRVAGSAAIAHVLAQDVARWTRPGRIPAKPAIGMRARLCVPLRWRGDLLGLLMVIDADDDLPAADRALIDAAAREVAALLVGERAAADAAVAADDALVADLLSLDPAARERAVAALAARAGRSGQARAGRRRRTRRRLGAARPAGHRAARGHRRPRARRGRAPARGARRTPHRPRHRGRADRGRRPVLRRHDGARRADDRRRERGGGRAVHVRGGRRAAGRDARGGVDLAPARRARHPRVPAAAGPGGGRRRARRVRPAATHPGARPHRAPRAGRDAAGRRPPGRARAHAGGLPAARGLRPGRRGRAAHPPHHAALPPRPHPGDHRLRPRRRRDPPPPAPGPGGGATAGFAL